MPPKKKSKIFTPRTTIPPTPTFMRKKSRKQSIMTICTTGVFAGMKTNGYILDDEKELDKIIFQAAEPELRIAMVNLALPPVSHVFIMMKVRDELRVYDVQNHYASSGLVPTFYDDLENEMGVDCTGYRYFLNGLLRRLQMTRQQLKFMPSPELSAETWEIIDFSAETGKPPTKKETRGACLLWCDAVLNLYWRNLLDEAFPDN